MTQIGTEAGRKLELNRTYFFKARIKNRAGRFTNTPQLIGPFHFMPKVILEKLD
jgi:hypothetical protein